MVGVLGQPNGSRLSMVSLLLRRAVRRTLPSRAEPSVGDEESGNSTGAFVGMAGSAGGVGWGGVGSGTER